MESKYAPSEKDVIELIKEDFSSLNSIEYIEKLINTLPYLGIVLNDKRQAVFLNEKLLEFLNIKDVEKLLGKRHGELLNCINANNDTGGCGTTEKCSVCGVVNCILKSQNENRKIVTECRINANKNNEQIAYDFKVTTSPFNWHGKTFYVLSLVDISDEKRRQALEKIFFHDVMNKTVGIYSLIDLLKQESDPKQVKKFIAFIEQLNNDLMQEILAQKELAQAENGELSVTISPQNSIEIIKNSIEQIQHHDIAKGKKIETGEVEVFNFATDGVLLRRVLMNMLKNALEASSVNQPITIACKVEGNYCRFWVHNCSVIPKRVKMQLFLRSFSTKGAGRGLGTYSAKIIGERYLGGEVGVVSESGQGTIFYINLPK